MDKYDSISVLKFKMIFFLNLELGTLLAKALFDRLAWKVYLGINLYGPELYKALYSHN